MRAGAAPEERVETAALGLEELLGASLVVDVAHGDEPADDAAGLGLRHRADAEPAVAAALGLPDARDVLEGHAAGLGAAPALDRFGLVLGVEDLAHAGGAHLLEAEAGELHEGGVHVVDDAVGIGGADELDEVVGEEAQRVARLVRALVRLVVDIGIGDRAALDERREVLDDPSVGVADGGDVDLDPHEPDAAAEVAAAPDGAGPGRGDRLAILGGDGGEPARAARQAALHHREVAPARVGRDDLAVGVGREERHRGLVETWIAGRPLPERSA